MTALTPPPYLSASSIFTFLQCPMKYKFSRIDGMKEDPTEATLLGNFVHDVLEDLYNSPSEERTLGLAKSLARLQWDLKWEEQMRPWVPESRFTHIRWSAWWCIENLWKLENPQEIEPDGCETELNVSIAGVPIKGFVDRWSKNDDGKIIVTDYKSGKTPRPQYQEDKYVQLIIYALGLEEMNLGEVSEIELLFLKDGDRLRRSITSDDRQKVVELVSSVKSNIDKRCETNEFETKPTKLCNWCSFKPICPYWVNQGKLEI